MEEIPETLVDAIRRGNCVAFIGTGFTQPAGLPTWGKLLRLVVTEAQQEGRITDKDLLAFINLTIDKAVKGGSGEQYELAAQLLEDALGTEELERRVAAQLELPKKDLPPQMQRRLDLIDAIPFRAILTTNFNMLTVGTTPFDIKRSFADVLRPTEDHDRQRFSVDEMVQNHIQRNLGIFLPTNSSANISPTLAAQSLPASSSTSKFPSTTGNVSCVIDSFDNGSAMHNTTTHLSNTQLEALQQRLGSTNSGLPSYGTNGIAALNIGGGAYYNYTVTNGTNLTAGQRGYLESRPYRPIIKIHGSLDPDRALVWSRTGYRRLQHTVPGYTSFMRSVLATCTVLYLGFSFSDGYLNELRGEVLSMLYGGGGGVPRTITSDEYFQRQQSTYFAKVLSANDKGMGRLLTVSYDSTGNGAALSRSTATTVSTSTTSSRALENSTVSTILTDSTIAMDTATSENSTSRNAKRTRTEDLASSISTISSTKSDDRIDQTIFEKTSKASKSTVYISKHGGGGEGETNSPTTTIMEVPNNNRPTITTELNSIALTNLPHIRAYRQESQRSTLLSPAIDDHLGETPNVYPTLSSASSSGAPLLLSSKELPPPIGFAVVNDKSIYEIDFFRRHEGVQILTWDSKNNTEFGVFDEYLAAIHEETSYAHYVGRITAGKRLLICEPVTTVNTFQLLIQKQQQLLEQQYLQQQQHLVPPPITTRTGSLHSTNSVPNVATPVVHPRLSAMRDLAPLLQEAVARYAESQNRKALIREQANSSRSSSLLVNGGNSYKNSDTNPDGSATNRSTSSASTDSRNNSNVNPLLNTSSSVSRGFTIQESVPGLPAGVNRTPLEGGGYLDIADTVENAVLCLAATINTDSDNKHLPYDAILTVFGEDRSPEKKHAWVQLVNGMRKLPNQAQTPFIVYSTTHNVENRCAYVLRHGGFEFATTFNELVRALARLLDKRRGHHHHHHGISSSLPLHSTAASYPYE